MTVLAAVVVAALQMPASAIAEMVRFEGGEYTLGHAVGGPQARPVHTITLKPFRLDRFEVTNGQFAAFLNALDVRPVADADFGAVTPKHVAGADADRLMVRDGGRVPYVELDDSDSQIGIRGGRFAAAPDLADHPVNEVTWPGATAYCHWRGARLPTEAEWEAAARGRAGRPYPWGAEAPSRGRAAYGRASGETEPVAALPDGATPEGLHHMAGNVAEWTSSLFRPYPYDPADGREDGDDPGERVTRGGDHVFDVAAERLTTYFRSGFSRNPTRGHRHIGMRCAADG